MLDSLSPASLVLLGGISWLWLRGLARPRLAGSPVSELRHAGFLVSLALWLATFNGPLAGAAHRLFVLHQAAHLGLRLLAPLLFALANPWPVLIAGLPSRMRRAVRRFGAKLALVRRLPVALVLLIGWFYLWQLPPMHNAALTSPALTLLAHLGMVLSGVNFFACVLDRRDGPKAHLQGPRVLAAIVVILSNILLGSLTTLKEVVLYSGYDETGRLWNTRPLVDEIMGGYTIWVPSSMVMIVTILLIITGWNAAELRRWENRYALMRRSNSAALEFPETAEELRLKVTEPNRRTAFALALTSLSVFLVVMTTVTLLVYIW